MRWAVTSLGFGVIFMLSAAFEYWDQLQDYDEVATLFEFAPATGRRVYPPGRISGLRDRVNEHGLYGRPPRPGERLALSAGSCTALDYHFALQELLDARGANCVVWSAARGHLTEREVLLQLDELLSEIKPDFLIANLATVMVRDIHFHGKDFYAVPERVVAERAFGWWGGGIGDFAQYWLRRRRNQFDYAADNRAVEAARTGKREFDALAVVERTLPRYAADLDRMCRLGHEKGARLVLLTPPYDLGGTPPLQQDILARFNAAIRVAARKHGAALGDLTETFAAGNAGDFFWDNVHLTRQGAHRAALVVADALKNSGASD